MRLLKIIVAAQNEQLDIKIHEYYDDYLPPYAILSHRWRNADDEVSYLEFTHHFEEARKKKGFEKIEACCTRALQDGLFHVWVDTCCIDKSSSAELSEAINSMFKWYMHSQVCYAYLEDVDSWEDHYVIGSAFRQSPWFTRGWTLQELIAPANVRFFGKNWIEIGQKCYMTSLLSQITKIPESVLLKPHDELEDICISQKLYWASGRRTTRIEDRAYSLIGLFNISIPILYGEGKRAFTRLQEKILRVSFDHTIFAWQLRKFCSGLIAESPDDFSQAADIKKMSMKDFHNMFELKLPALGYAMTNVGLSLNVPYRHIKSHKGLYIAFLACYYAKKQTPIFIYLRRDHSKLSSHYFRTRKSTRSIGDGLEYSAADIRLFQLQGSVFSTNPYGYVLRAIKPPVSQVSNSIPNVEPQGSQIYYIHLFFQGQAMAVFPMADIMEKNHIVVETEARSVWVASISIRRDCRVWLLIAVIDDKLLLHINTHKDYKYSPIDSSDALHSCEEFYTSCCSSPQCPKTYVTLKASRSNDEIHGSSFNDVELVSLSQEFFYDPTLRRKVFSIWLKVDRRRNITEIEKQLPMVPPGIWYSSLESILKDCKPLSESITETSSEHNPYYECSYNTEYVEEHASDCGPEYETIEMLATQHGNTDGSDAGKAAVETLLGRSMDQAYISNPKSTQLGYTVTHTGYNSSSEDSVAFNSGFKLGYIVGNSAGFRKYMDEEWHWGHAPNYATKYGSSFSTSYFQTYKSTYAVLNSTSNVPKHVTERASAYGSGYGTGYLAGFSAGQTNCLDGNLNEVGIFGNIFTKTS